MANIHVLGFEIANLIAAGEVVDRPASVLKELLENAIDAGATRIEAEISHGGVRSIRVTDNGCGMTAEDLPVAIRRHATSKIRAAEDLNGIFTLGFRGEALAAISAVSDVRIVTKTKEASSGTMLTAEGGTVTDLCEVGSADGTTVLVENIFAKVPARRKFLKKDATEAMACAAQMEKIAMSHPEIAFRFVSDGEVRFSTAGDGSAHSVLYAIYGRNFASRLLSVKGGNDAVQVEGFVGRSDNSHGNRNMQNVFINGRYVKSKTVGAALERAFTSYMAPERFPVSCLYLTVDPRHVDVNVHPAKLEVRFSDERTVFEAVYYAVRGALESNTDRPELTLATSQKEQKAREIARSFAPVGTPRAEQFRMPESPRPAASPSVTPSPLRVGGEGRKPVSAPVSELSPAASREVVDRLATVCADTTVGGQGGVYVGRRVNESPVPFPEVEAERPAPVPATPAYRYVGTAFRCYLMVETDDSTLLVIDQHAAHERVIFEDLLAKQKADGRIASQAMLLPLDIPMTPNELSAVTEAKEELDAVGFTFLTREGGVSLTAIPDAIAPDAAGELFLQMAADLADGTGTPENTDAKRRERSLYQIACKAAIKGGRTYGAAQIEWLIGRVLALPDITVCPHGRPIAYRLTKAELDRQFDRIK